MFARPILRRLAGFLSHYPRDARARREEVEILSSFYPVNLRTTGIVFDIYESNPDIATYPLEQISVPTLVVHARDDPLASYEDARAMAECIPHARFVTVPRGGHVFMHRNREALGSVRKFLSRAAPRSATNKSTVRRSA
jgi:pimeloyl-ACP methyl ester carboxylesterase